VKRHEALHPLLLNFLITSHPFGNLLKKPRRMPRNVLQTLTVVALVAAIIFVAHNFVRYVLRGKCSCALPFKLVMCKDRVTIHDFALHKQ